MEPAKLHYIHVPHDQEVQHDDATFLSSNQLKEGLQRRIEKGAEK